MVVDLFFFRFLRIRFLLIHFHFLKMSRGFPAGRSSNGTLYLLVVMTCCCVVPAELRGTYTEV